MPRLRPQPSKTEPPAGTPMTAAEKKANNVRETCPRCFKVDEDDRLNCVNRPLRMCPETVSLEGESSVEVVCAAPCGGPCGKHLAVPIGNVMKRRQLTNLGQCAFDVCRARVVTSTTTASVPAPIGEAKPVDWPADAGE